MVRAMRAPSTILGLAAVVALASCASPQKPPAPTNVAEEAPAAAAPAEIARPAEPPLPTIPDSPAPAPASLFAVIGVADPSATLDALGRYADAANPGLGAMVSTQLVELAVAELYGVDLAGVDYSRPMWALVLDPSLADAPVLVVAVADRDAFDAAMEQGGGLAIHHRGFAAIGSRIALEEAAPHALSSIALGTAPVDPTATVLVPAVMDRYGRQLAGSLAFLSATMAQGGGNGEAVRSILEGLVSLLEQTEQVTLRLDTSAELSVVAELVPKSDAAMVEIFARQPAASFDAMAHYPDASIVFGGKLDWESLRDALKPFTDSALAQWGGAGDPMQGLWAEMFPLLTGEMGYAMQFSGTGTTWMAGHWGVSDPKKVREITARATKVFADVSASGGGPFELGSRTFKYKKVQVTGTTMTPRSTASAEERAGFVAAFGEQPISSLFAVVGKTVVMSMGDGADRRIKAAIDRVKAKKAAKPSAALAAALAAARDRKESVLTLIDLAGFTGAPSGAAPLAFGLGFTGGRLSARLTVPAEQVLHLIQKQQAAAPPTP